VTLRVVDVSEPDSALDAALPGAPVVAVGSLTGASEFWLQHATFTLTEDDADDRRVITVASIDAALATLSERVECWPIAAATCDDVLRAVDPAGPALPGVVTESLAYSTLQAGPEFARWLAGRGPATMPDIADPVQTRRDGDTLRIAFNRPQRHNAFSTDARAALLEVLAVAQLDSSVDEVVLTGNGPSFCSGGDLAEFGTFADPANAHLARTRHSPALALDAVTSRLGKACRAEVHGQVLGSGLEMAAFCGRITAAPDAVFGLPELSLGLIPGAGGTVSVTRRIGRWRTAYLVLSGSTIDVETAVAWGLADTKG
jgi:Enoyl-CoA hydratase/isomerase